MQDFESRVHTPTKEGLEGVTVEWETEQVLPGQEPIFVWILTELFEHSFNLLHVELGLNG
jgi:hypothetical protein